MGNQDETAGFKSTDIAQFDKIIATARATFRSGKTKSIAWRKHQLRQLYRLVDENRERMCEAVLKDFKKPRHEGMLSEVLVNLNHIAYNLHHIDQWSKPDYPEKGIPEIGAGLTVEKEPFGVCLIIAPWNYPLDLILKPLTSALCAGNTAVCKPSEITPHCAMLLAELFPKYLDPSAVFVVNGGIKETTALLEKKWDQITYTGSTAVGRIIMAAAAKHLTPVVLELGGKSPVVIDSRLTPAEIERAAARLVSAKFMNNGQTCIAPDYVLCPTNLVRPFTAALAGAITRSYGADPQSSPDLARVVNKAHTKRLGTVLDQQKTVPGTLIVAGGNWDESQCYVAPTIISGVKADGPIMQSEIFGPILPVVDVDTVDSAIDFILARDRPLALYVFSSDSKFSERVHKECISGGVSINDAVYHGAVDSASFGGVGPSGMGCLHGHYGFLAFTHQKTVLAKPLDYVSEVSNQLTFRYPPYTDKNTNMLMWIARSAMPKDQSAFMKAFKVLAVAGAATGVAYSLAGRFMARKA